MAREKKAAKEKQTMNKGEAAIDRAATELNNVPSIDCHLFMLQVMVSFYENENPLSMDNKYLRYRSEAALRLKVDLKQRIMDAMDIDF